MGHIQAALMSICGYSMEDSRYSLTSDCSVSENSEINLQPTSSLNVDETGDCSDHFKSVDFPNIIRKRALFISLIINNKPHLRVRAVKKIHEMNICPINK